MKLCEFFIPVVIISCLFALILPVDQCVQVQDYGCALKMDDGQRILSLQHQLLQVFLILDGPQSREYQRALTVSLHLWEWMKASDHPAWHIFKHNASAWNEESGEICFSVLAREVASNGVRADCAAVSRKFNLIKPKMQVARDLKLDLCGEDFASKKHARVLKDSVDVQAAVVFFQRMIRQLANGTHRHFGSDCGKLDAKARRAKGARRTVPAEVLPILSKKKTDATLVTVRAKLKKSHKNFWVWPHKDIWPAAHPTDPDLEGCDASEEESESASSSEADVVEELKAVDGQNAKHGRKRKRSGSAQQDEKLLNRVVAVPAWCLGQAWARKAFGGRQAARQARLHGRLEESKKTGCLDCRFFHDRDYLLQLTKRQVNKYLVACQDEAQAVDTPFVIDASLL